MEKKYRKNCLLYFLRTAALLGLASNSVAKHRKSAKLPWHHNIKLSFCLFVKTLFWSNVWRVSSLWVTLCVQIKDSVSKIFTFCLLFVVCPQAWHHKKIGYFRYSIYYLISLLTGQSAPRVMKRIFTSVLPHISLTNLLQTWTQWYWMGKGFNEMKSEQLKPVHYIWGSWKIGFKVGNFDK